MPKFEVEWYISARGVETVEAESVRGAEDIVGNIDTDKLMSNADRFDYEVKGWLV